MYYFLDVLLIHDVKEEQNKKFHRPTLFNLHFS